MDKEYKISEFAKHLGVTPGFLKHHEGYGTLKPQIAESGYRYYRREDGMQVLNCLKLQGMGFTSREVADILESAQDAQLPQLLHAQQHVLTQKIALYQETLGYMQEIERTAWELDACGGEVHAICLPEPFYYLENMQEGVFVDEPLLQEAAEKWNGLMPLVEHASRISNAALTESGVRASSYAMGLAVRCDRGDRLGVHLSSAVARIDPGPCLVFRRQGVRPQSHGRRETSLDRMLQRPLEICRSLNLTIAGDIFVIKTFGSLAHERNYVREPVLVPIKN